MITSRSGSQKVNVHGVGPQAGIMTLAEFRDAVGYSKQSPQPARQAKLSGVIKLAGSTVTINTTGILDGNQISGLAATDGLLGAAVAGDGIPDGTTVTGILPNTPNTPSLSGAVLLSNVAPYAPATRVPQPIIFNIIAARSTISGLAATGDLEGARVSASGIPDGTVVKEVTIPAAAPTNTRAGKPGEIVLLTPIVPPPAAFADDLGVSGRANNPGGEIVLASRDGRAPVDRPAAVLTPVDVTFDIPTAPIVFPDDVSVLALSPTEPLAALTVTLPPNPVDGALARIFSTLAIAELTVLANAGQTLNWSPRADKPADDPPVPPSLALAADTGVEFLYSTSNATWDRVA